MIFDASLPAFIVIFMMALVTVFTRWVGYYLIGFVTIGPRIEAAFRSLPGGVAAATILPIVVQDGATALAAVLMSAVVARRGMSDFFAVLAALGTAILLRQTGL